jgi:integrase/recombinase XerD
MKHPELLTPWLRRFLLEYLIDERNLSLNTQRSYRDGLTLLLPFAAKRRRCSVEALVVEDLSAPLTREFLHHLAVSRHCSPRTQNQRLALLHALARFIAQRRPEYWDWATQIQAVPFRKCPTELVPFLEPEEIHALLEAPNQSSPQGRRDHALLLFLYNTGARADEAAKLTVADLDLDAASVRLHGKGNKRRCCPLWKDTVKTLTTLVAGRSPQSPVFLSCRGQALTRFGIHTLVERHVRTASQPQASMRNKRVSPHCLRHTTAMHLLRSGVDINTIRAWLGHASLQTTHIYAQSDLQMKAKALAVCAPPASKQGTKPPVWKPDVDTLQFLRSL